MPKNQSDLIIDRPFTGTRRGGSSSSGGGGGATTFLGLTDTPSSYSGADGYIVTVDETGNTLVFEPGGTVTSVNAQAGAVVLDADDISDAATTNKFATAAELADIASAVQPGDLAAVATTGAYADLSGAPSIPATFDDLTDGTTNKAFTSTEKTKLAGIEAAADVTDAGNVGAAIVAASTDDTIDDADLFPRTTGGTLVKTAWSNIKATLLTYLSPLFARLGGTAGGQHLKGGTGSGDDLILESTSHATKGQVIVPLGSAVNIGDDPLASTNVNISAVDSFLVVARYVATATGSGMAFRKSRDAAVGNHGLVLSGDTIGTLSYQGSDGLAYRAAVQIVGVVDGTAAAGDMPGRIELRVSPAGSVTPVTAVYIKSDKRVGVNQSSPQAQVDILQSTLGQNVLRLQSTATNDDPTEDKFHGRTTTTNATVATVLTIPITASNTYFITAEYVARRTGGTGGTAEDGGGGRVSEVYKTVAGAVAFQGSVEDNQTHPFGGGAGLSMTESGTNVLVQVTGAVNNNVVWHVFVTVRRVGT